MNTLIIVAVYQSQPYYSCLSVCAAVGLCVSVCLSVCLAVCASVCVHQNSKNNGSVHLKLEHIVVYEKSSDEFDVVQSRPRSWRDFEIFLRLPQYKLSSPISQLWHMLGRCD